MAYRSFRQFLDALEQAGELKRVTIPVDTELLIAEWADREMKSPGGGKALLFEQPIVDGKKSQFPVAINTMGSRRRMAMALQVSDVEDVAREIQHYALGRLPSPDASPVLAYAGVEATVDERKSWGIIEID